MCKMRNKKKSKSLRVCVRVYYIILNLEYSTHGSSLINQSKNNFICRITYDFVVVDVFAFSRLIG